MDDEFKKRIIANQKLAFQKKANKIKKNIFRSIYKEINNFFKKNFFNFLFNFYYYYKTLFNFNKNKILECKISILIPTRNRSKKLDRFLKTLKKKTSKLSRLELLILFDFDETEFEKYIQILNDYKNDIKIKIFRNSFNTHAKRNNFLAKNSSGTIIFPANDDIVIDTKDWDNLIDKEVAKFKKDEPFCLWPDSGNKYPFLHCHFPIINNIWYKKLGYVGSELFNFWYLDTWICDLAKKSKKMIYVKKIKFKEFNAQANIEEFDETYLKNFFDNKMEKDMDIWNNSSNIRLKESKKLIN